MATTNRFAIDTYKNLSRDKAAELARYLVSESRSRTAPAVTGGTVTDFVTVPAGEFWTLRSVRVVNGDTAARNVEVQVQDADGTVHAVLANGVSPVSVAAGSSYSFTTPFLLPPSWRLSVTWTALAADAAVNWQYTAIEVNANTLHEHKLLV